MGWFWADSIQKSVSPSATGAAKCPVDHTKLAACPVVHSDGAETLDINPLNNMPYVLPTDKVPGQKIDLPTERTLSSIPRGDVPDQGVWEYPSPQQMFNAMIRKGKGDVPEDAVESMVNIHNFLNEGAWSEILKWEKPHTEQTKQEPRLLKFTGRPHDLTPRARFYQIMGKLFPDKYATEPPFDRHDWTVLRGDGQGGWRQVRYVIDYYGGPEDEDGMPTFFLDVRPALDSFSSARDRFEFWLQQTKPTWDKAMGRD
ncbi:hypothetical protein KL905_001856 [Ogataea polymorpha]|uniref:Holocytochrome c-type synthase n=1 Tax=Ogataea polymorpha TaxID=460523 RepID=A0A9P8T4C7_9ASCO|nr:hypothetical protein KL937_000326 [Ogataea polymorpha]KAG7895840.1 hypothetical protein KL936_000548 [Ogataea polymorpha]KAG7896283.1 hypothetical protein KL908_000797 [Ogataea polymorpha]KAG7908416.1 hypothetical protein KL907_001906 [Ogataea polymorpha]KAG7922635.1 hypothetical protein KL905_001856 [Ogataea polymorpha]